MRDIYFKDCFINGFNKINNKLKKDYKIKSDNYLYDYSDHKNSPKFEVYRKITKDLLITFVIDTENLYCYFNIFDGYKDKFIFKSKTSNFKNISKTKINLKNYIYNGLLYIEKFVIKFGILYEN